MSNYYLQREQMYYKHLNVDLSSNEHYQEWLRMEITRTKTKARLLRKAIRRTEKIINSQSPNTNKSNL